MRIRRIKLSHFRRFSDLEVSDIPDSAKLVILAGPNGSGKSSLFDAMNVSYQLTSGLGWAGDNGYYSKSTDLISDVRQRVRIEVHTGEPARGSFYFRSAYRNDPEFSLSSLSQIGSAVDDLRFRRMIESDATVTQNYQRLASQAFENIFSKENVSTTIGEFRDKFIGVLRDALLRVFPDLTLNNLGNPLENGTFRFTKGTSSGFEYRNLSGGEKAAFDLLLDIVVKSPSFPEAIYCIDEPEAHMSTRLQGALLEELCALIPVPAQLWIATHSIGMMRKAREMAIKTPGSVAFIDFGGHDFDNAVVIKPSQPTRKFWESVLSVALDDLSTLVAPKEVVVCEGNPAGAIPGKNAEHDATIFNTIFGDHVPDTKFLAGGNAKDVASDRLGFVAALPNLASGIKVRRLIDRDDHAPADIYTMKSGGITTLGRRHLESYTYDDEVLVALSDSVGKRHMAADLVRDKEEAIADSVARGNPPDDVKSAAGTIYAKMKQRLGLTGSGNDQMSFARNTLAPLIKPGMAIFDELKRDVFAN